MVSMPQRSRPPEIGPFLFMLVIFEVVVLLLIFLDV